MTEETKQPQLAEAPPEKVTRVEIDTDNLSDDQRRALEALGIGDEDLELSYAVTQEFDSLEDLLEAEQLEDDGLWFDWPDLPGSKVLIGHPENATLAYAKCEREVRTKHRVGVDDQLPPHLIMKAAGMASFGRSVKGWTLELAGKPYEFNLVNFMRMWRRRRFRNFLSARWTDFRERPQVLSEESGKN